MYEVLVPIDGNESRALSQAETVAGFPGADASIRAILLHVFEENPSGASVHQIGAVRRAKSVLEERGVEVELAETSGNPPENIVRTADERDVDLLCLAGRKRTPTGKALFGSVTQDVLLSSDRPVVVCEADESAAE
ncbi:universal stress protein [Salinilacihabitans rarus]|uniref:universal stress protein n=1 Tax=Salinilacihabitans rarus TaxID=2961596 RepID=UPI0020C8AFF4|nr:universal stress protein [Salinilacihabitans rarus]